MTRTDILLIATGEYSDYSNSAFKVLKPFNLGEVFDIFIAEHPEKQTDRKDFRGNPVTIRPSPGMFIAWLNERGYVEDLDIHEVHVGLYSTVAIDEYQRPLNFAPKGE